MTLGLLAPAALAVAWSIAPPEPGPTYANYLRLQEGMSRDEVVAILGEPSPNRYRTELLSMSALVAQEESQGPIKVVQLPGDGLICVLGNWEQWEGHGATIRVRFDGPPWDLHPRLADKLYVESRQNRSLWAPWKTAARSPYCPTRPTTFFERIANQEWPF